MWKAQNNSFPVQSGPGIVICEPVTTPADPTESSFGAGCALWLQMTVGGLPQLGKTPLWSALDRARAEMSRPDLQLSSAEALTLAPILGVTHAAVGALRGSEPHLILTYRLLQVPGGTPVGVPIKLAGTREQIDRGLPQAARTLSKGLGIAAPNLPASTGLTPADLQLLGQIRWQKTALTEPQQAAVEALAARHPLAGLLNLSRGAGRTAARFNAAAQTLLAQDGDNALVWGEIAEQSSLALLPHAGELAALAARYPGNYNLAVAETFRFRVVEDRKPELQAAERIIQNAPHNPDGWLTYAWAVSEVADDVRHGRYFGALTSEESDYVNRLYPQWEAALQRAVQLDPAFAKAWLRLATAATFNSDAAQADHALQTALALSEDKADVYGWALEMYQPKWNDDPAKLGQFAHQAAEDTTLSAGDVVSLAGELRSSGNPVLQQKVLSDFIARRRAFLRTHPGDGESHWGLAKVLETLGDKKGAVAEYQTAITLLPQNAVVHYDLGKALSAPDTYDQAVAQFQEAVRIDPDYPDAHFYLGYGQKRLGHYEEAERELKAALRLSPAFGKAYAALGDVYVLQNNFPEAIPNYQTAIRFGAYNKDNYEHLTEALIATGQYDQVLTTGKEALRIYPDGDAYLYDGMANAYLHKQEWDKSLALSQAVLALSADDPWAHENLAEAYLGMGRTADAQSEWRKVLTFKDDQMKAVAEGFLKKYP